MDSSMTDQEKITALRDALNGMLEQFTKTPSTLADSNARCEAHRALAMTAEASEPSGEPVDLWPLIDAYSDYRAIYQHSTDRHMAKVQRWNVENAKAAIIAALTHPATKQASPATNSAPTRRAFDQSALDYYAERAK